SAVDETTKDVKANVLAAQDGTLTGTGGTSIAENYDVRKGNGTLKVSGTAASLNGDVSLTNQFAIFKFTTKNGGSDLNVRSLTVTIGTKNYVITPTAATNVLYAALPAVTTAQTVIVSATTDSDKNYFFAKDGVSFAASKYYQSTLAMTQGAHLAALTADYTVQDGDVLTGTLGGNYKISIANGATVTLDGVTINGTNNENYSWAGLTPLGDATIILKDGTTNSVKGFYNNYPGIFAAVDKTLIIKGETAGTGTLTASSNGYGAGIGGGYKISSGNIEIQGGVITADGGTGAAGIGGGSQGSCGTITISDGTITANGGSSAAGIGSGPSGSSGNITISGGTVTANGRGRVAGIGGGSQGSCGTITITSDVTSVTATKGADATYSIGAGYNGTCGTVTIGGTEGAIKTSPYTYPPAPVALSAVTASNQGWIVGEDGNAYAFASIVPGTVNAVGILGTVTETGHGLILALQDATYNTWNTINDWASETTYAGTTLKLLPDDAARGALTSYTTLGDTSVSNWAVAQKADYEAIFINLGSTRNDNNGYTYDAHVNAYITGAGGTALSGYCWSATENPEYGSWTSHSNSWCGSHKASIYSVRPVLGF
ncbi:MAG: hypothetical protein J6S94_00625, partial [Bacteroidaceae bacterium]|nr:hypothetical protein [Bacteroidaceae bacterium]